MIPQLEINTKTTKKSKIKSKKAKLKGKIKKF